MAMKNGLRLMIVLCWFLSMRIKIKLGKNRSSKNSKAFKSLMNLNTSASSVDDAVLVMSGRGVKLMMLNFLSAKICILDKA
jgi:hypothetical protein